ncbi:glucose-6-phosphate isomerase [Aquirhabdus parva]|uniref:Glucose-6-phosphate isomerase n=1 Tax=Aquirhabdus parva TaxID=2283318 RepID=A0A345PAF7_9GAMM|nr:glucose-6-phosphate isomerase [Aquirhabdus parva]AXI04266.1 glucose-6-phosphate isomerase [Aquirhabdus parva]
MFHKDIFPPQNSPILESSQIESGVKRIEKQSKESMQSNNLDRHIFYANTLFDFSNQLISDSDFDQLILKARKTGLVDAIAQLKNGGILNQTEHRKVLHTALRAKPDNRFPEEMQQHIDEASQVRVKMRRFVDELHAGHIKGATGKTIKYIVNIGVGGSNLGSRLVTQALARFRHPSIAVSYVANIDADDLYQVLQRVNPEETMFLVTSKTFTTFETMQNAIAARGWLEKQLNLDSTIILQHHFVGITAEVNRAVAFGIDPERTFEFWDWVGGRFSLWSAVGLPIAIAVGMDLFEELLAGARAMDEHFFSAPLESNIPVLMGLIGAWNIEENHAAGLSIAPYCHGLRSLPAYLQQLEMESNGKGIDIYGQPTKTRTAQVVFGSVGSNGQHAYFQMLHQGTRQIPTDFIAVAEDLNIFEGHQDQLLANCFAQSAALATGRIYPDEPHKTCAGGQRSTVIVLPQLNAFSVGLLLAAYEHKIFVQAHIWEINAFDQWGVELGKSIAHDILPVLQGHSSNCEVDNETQRLIKHIQFIRENLKNR